jgi:hypothetical protein
VLSLTSEEGSLAVIDAVSRLSGQEAIDSLVRHAVFSGWPLVREAAAERLSQQRRESYVPLMVREMYTPLVSRFDVARLPNGRMGYRHAFEREGQDERQLLLLDTEYRRVRRFTGDARESLLRAFFDSLAGVSQREALAARQNVVQAALNQRLTEALNIATHQQLPVEPQRWWQWWDEENEIGRQGNKQVVSRQQVQQLAVVDRPSQLSSSQIGLAPPVQARAECFVAGTQVLTQQGMRPIETVRVGDVVLAQDVDSGELAFKPVLRTTVRPAGPLLQVQVGRDVFQATGGHLFWVAGEGWVKAKNLSSGMDVHCLRGSLASLVTSISLQAETYNLVVADFHTYFVGQERVLTHDVTPRRPTPAIVPGLRDD